MHPAPAFQQGADAALRIARAHPFASVTVFDGQALRTVQLPLIDVVDEAGKVVAFEGHLAASNRLAHGTETGVEDWPGMAVFLGPDAYVSPSSYPSKQTHGRAVPTWNFLSAEAEGRVSLDHSAEAVRGVLARQTAVFEAGELQPWSIADAPQDYIDQLVGALVAIRLDVDRFEATIKLSQNKAGSEIEGVVAALNARGDQKSRAIAALMTELETG